MTGRGFLRSSSGRLFCSGSIKVGFLKNQERRVWDSEVESGPISLTGTLKARAEFSVEEWSVEPLIEFERELDKEGV